jgi:hypothetical protein
MLIHFRAFASLLLGSFVCLSGLGCSTTDVWPLRRPQSVAWNVDPSIPVLAKAPQGHVLLGHAIGRGVQVYTCQDDRSGGREWVLSGVDADLLDDDGNQIGRHYTSGGPTWEFTRGGKVVAQRLVTVPQRDAAPWLLLGVTSKDGGGTLGHADYVQRLHTSGGLPPATCDSSDAGRQIRVQYTADYYFYGPLAAPTRTERD